MLDLTRAFFEQFDTMLAEYSDEEIEVVLAHELAHHVHGDIWKGIAFESVLILAGFYLSSRVLAWLAPAAGLRVIERHGVLPLGQDAVAGAVGARRHQWIRTRASSSA